MRRQATELILLMLMGAAFWALWVMGWAIFK